PRTECPGRARQPASPARNRRPRTGESAPRAGRCPRRQSPPPPSRSFFGELRELLGLVLGSERVDDVVELAVHDAVDLVERQVDAVVGDAALREVVGADALRAVARADQGLARRGGLRRELLLLLVLDARRKHRKRALAVLVLGARVLALDDDPGRQVRDA